MEQTKGDGSTMDNLRREITSGFACAIDASSVGGLLVWIILMAEQGFLTPGMLDVVQACREQPQANDRRDIQRLFSWLAAYSHKTEYVDGIMRLLKDKETKSECVTAFFGALEVNLSNPPNQMGDELAMELWQWTLELFQATNGRPQTEERLGVRAPLLKGAICRQIYLNKAVAGAIANTSAEEFATYSAHLLSAIAVYGPGDIPGLVEAIERPEVLAGFGKNHHGWMVRSAKHGEKLLKPNGLLRRKLNLEARVADVACALYEFQPQCRGQLERLVDNLSFEEYFKHWYVQLNSRGVSVAQLTVRLACRFIEEDEWGESIYWSEDHYLGSGSIWDMTATAPLITNDDSIVLAVLEKAEAQGSHLVRSGVAKLAAMAESRPIGADLLSFLLKHAQPEEKPMLMKAVARLGSATVSAGKLTAVGR